MVLKTVVGKASPGVFEGLEGTRVTHVATATLEATHTGPGDTSFSTDTPTGISSSWLCSAIFPHPTVCFKPSW